jgi:murein DD-endopeptidase MepM/ murein hydrolase activator NlpD
MSSSRFLMLSLHVVLTIAILAALFPQSSFSTPPQAMETIMIKPPLVYQGHTYTVEYQATGKYRRKDANIFFAADPTFFEKQSIVGLTVYRDDKRLTDEDELYKVFTLYTAAYLLYELSADDYLGSISSDFRDDLHRVTNNPLFIEQWVKGLFKSRQEQTQETLRALLSPKITQPTVELFGQEVRRNLEKVDTGAEAVDAAITGMKFSNVKAVRDLQKDARDTLKDWRRVTQQGTAYIDVGGGRRIHLANALEIISLGTRLLWMVNVNRERVEWLDIYQRTASSDAALDQEQMGAAALVKAESENTWLQRGEIILSFVREQTRDLGVKLAGEELARKWVSYSWKTFGKRTTGHLVAGVAAAAGLGLTLGDLLLGLDELYDNFRLAERADELRLRFRAGRLALKQQADLKGKETYDGRLAEAFRAAYMLEALSAAQCHRSYADGVEATVRDGLLGKLNPINWFKGKEWRDAVAELRKLAGEEEKNAEQNIGHPPYVDTAVALAMKGHVTLVDLTFPFQAGTTWRITQGYNGTTSHNISGNYPDERYAFDLQLVEKDKGGDYVVSDKTRGQPVLAAADGVVVWVRPGENGMGCLLLRHDQFTEILTDGKAKYYFTMYCHMDPILVKESTPKRHQLPLSGEGCVRVKQGEQVGSAGSVGTSIPHIHFHLFSAVDKPLGEPGRVAEPLVRLKGWVVKDSSGKEAYLQDSWLDTGDTNLYSGWIVAQVTGKSPLDDIRRRIGDPFDRMQQDLKKRIEEAFANFQKKVEDILKGAQQDIERRIAEELAKLQKEIERIIQEEFEKQLRQICGIPAMLILGMLAVILRKLNH